MAQDPSPPPLSGEVLGPEGTAITREPVASVVDSDETLRIYFLAQIKQKRSPHTLRAYTRELRRFYRWLQERGKSVKSLTLADCVEWEHFIEAPPAVGGWAGPRGEAEFTGTSSERTRAYGNNLLRTFLDKAVAHGYIPLNPMRQTIRDLTPRVVSQDKGKWFDDEQWDAIWRVLDAELDPDPHRAFLQVRRRWVVSLSYFLGLRRFEAAGHTMGAFFSPRPGSKLPDVGTGLYFKVLGKGKLLAEIPVVPKLDIELRRYRKYLELPERPAIEDPLPLVFNSSRVRAISPQRIHEICQEVYAEAADLLDHKGDTAGAADLRSATHHWLRHTFTTHLQRQEGVPLAVYQLLTRHARAETLGIYSHAEAAALRSALGALGPPEARAA